MWKGSNNSVGRQTIILEWKDIVGCIKPGQNFGYFFSYINKSLKFRRNFSRKLRFSGVFLILNNTTTYFVILFCTTVKQIFYDNKKSIELCYTNGHSFSPLMITGRCFRSNRSPPLDIIF